MSDNNEIDESLKACREIEDFLIKDDMKKDSDGFLDFDFNNETFREIDKILEEVDTSSYDMETQEDNIITTGRDENTQDYYYEEPTVSEPEVPEEPETIEVIPAKPFHLENLADFNPDTEIGFESSTDLNITEEEYIERHPFLRIVLSVLICIVVAMLLSLFINKFVAYHTSVEGSSMETTLSNGDQLIVETVSYYFREPERFDVVVFPYTENVTYIKRVIGLPGERIRIQDGTIYINGHAITENYGNEKMEDGGIAENEILLGEDEYFVLGDNRNASVDSRREDVGPITEDEIEGRAWLRFYPFSDFSFVD